MEPSGKVILTYFVEELKSSRKHPVEKPVTLYLILGRRGHQARVERLAQPGCQEHRGTKEGWAEASQDCLSCSRPRVVLLFVRNCPGPGRLALGLLSWVVAASRRGLAGLTQEVALLTDPPP